MLAAAAAVEGPWQVEEVAEVQLGAVAVEVEGVHKIDCWGIVLLTVGNTAAVVVYRHLHNAVDYM